jgi:three-Cys-motif partner protein
MVALRRPDELPPPPEDGLPTRSIKPHTHDKLHYWGCYLEAASTALKRQFLGVRVCADLFAGYGVCADSKTQERCWGSALLSLQVAAPFDLYFFNDIKPEATKTLAARAHELGISGAVVYELELADPDVLRKARALREVATIGPKVIVTTGDANAAHTVLKMVAPQGRRYICAVIDPQSAVYSWEALEALAFHERALDALVLFPDAMDLGRGLPYYLRPDRGGKLDRCFGIGSEERWREVAKASWHPESALRELYEEQMRKLLALKVGRPRTISRFGTKMPLYRLVFGSRSQKGIDIWDDICRRSRDDQYEFPFLGI